VCDFTLNKLILNFNEQLCFMAMHVFIFRMVVVCATLMECYHYARCKHKEEDAKKDDEYITKFLFHYDEIKRRQK